MEARIFDEVDGEIEERVVVIEGSPLVGMLVVLTAFIFGGLVVTIACWLIH